MQNFDLENDDGVEIDNEFGDGNGSQAKRNYDPINYFTFQSGDNYFRIMPEMFEAKERGLWALYYVRHWGYKNSKGKQNPLICVKKFDFRTKTVTSECVLCKDQDKYKVQIDNLDAKSKTLRSQLEGVNVQSVEYANIQSTLSSIGEELKDLRFKYKTPERKFWVNAMNKAGEFGLLALPKTVYEQIAGKRENNVRLPGLIKKLQDQEDIEALNVNQGVWFNIQRTGSTQYDTEYSVSVEKEIIEVNGRKVPQTKLAPLSNEQKGLALKKCRDLTAVFNHSVLSDEQMEAVVNGSPAALSAITSASRAVPTADVDSNFGKSIDPEITVKRGRVLTDDEIMARLKA